MGYQHIAMKETDCNYVLNNNILDKYHLDISDITEDLKSLSPMLEYVAEQEKENTSFIPILPYEYMIYAPGIYGIIRRNQNKGTRRNSTGRKYFRKRTDKEFCIDFE